MQYGQPILLNVDWLGVSVHFHDPKLWLPPKGGHFFVDLDGTNVWSCRRILYNQYAEKVATVLFLPKSALINGHAGIIEVANEWLYHGMSPNKILGLISDCSHFSITGMSRVDLAADFVPTDAQLDVVRQLAAGTMYVAGKRNGSQFWSSVPTLEAGSMLANSLNMLPERYWGRSLPHCQSWGHKTTAVKWKLYYKSKELLDAMGGKAFDKPYILDAWADAGFPRNDVWRLEVSIRNANQLTYQGEPLTYAQLQRYPREIYEALYCERFMVRKSEGHRDKTNDTRVDFLPIFRNKGVRVAKPKGTTQRNGRITLLRHLVASLDDNEVLLDEETRESVLWHIGDLVERDSLQQYFAAMVGMVFDEWQEQVRIRAWYLLDAGVKPAEIVRSDDRLMHIMYNQTHSQWDNAQLQ